MPPRGSRALIDHAFTVARRVRAETMVAHLASPSDGESRECGKCAASADWPDRIPGDELGDVECAITRQEWLAR